MAQEEEKDKITEAEGQSAAVTREGAPTVNDTETPSAVADNTATGTTNASTTANNTGFNPESVVDATTDAWQHDNNANNATPPAAPATPEEIPAWAAVDSNGRGLNEQLAYQAYGEAPILTAEQKEAEAKERNKKMRWAKLNDAIAAMSNLYFTSKYAPNAFDPNNLATKKLRERYDKIDADRDKDLQNWYNAVGPARANDIRMRQAWEQQQNANKEKEKDRRHDLNKLELSQNFTAGENEKNRGFQTSEREAAQAFTAGENEKNRKNRRTIASMRVNSGSGSGNGTGKYTALGRDGKLYTFDNEKDADNFAFNNGTMILYTEDKTTYDDDGKKTGTTKTDKYKRAGRLADLNPDQRNYWRAILGDKHIYGDEAGFVPDDNSNIVDYNPANGSNQ